MSHCGVVVLLLHFADGETDLQRPNNSSAPRRLRNQGSHGQLQTPRVQSLHCGVQTLNISNRASDLCPSISELEEQDHLKIGCRSDPTDIAL